MGRPAVFTRELNDAQLADMQAGVKGYVINSQRHRTSLYGPAAD